MTLDVNLQQDISNPESDEYKSVVSSAQYAVIINYFGYAVTDVIYIY